MAKKQLQIMDAAIVLFKKWQSRKELNQAPMLAFVCVPPPATPGAQGAQAT